MDILSFLENKKNRNEGDSYTPNYSTSSTGHKDPYKSYKPNKSIKGVFSQQQQMEQIPRQPGMLSQGKLDKLF
jgi:hypothetical protein